MCGPHWQCIMDLHAPVTLSLIANVLHRPHSAEGIQLQHMDPCSTESVSAEWIYVCGSFLHGGEAVKITWILITFTFCDETNGPTWTLSAPTWAVVDKEYESSKKSFSPKMTLGSFLLWADDRYYLELTRLGQIVITVYNCATCLGSH